MNLSETDKDVQKRKTNLSTAIPPAFDGKDPVNFGPLTTVYTLLMFSIYPSNWLLSEYHISVPRWLHFEIFTHAGEWLRLASAYRTGDGGYLNNFLQRRSEKSKMAKKEYRYME